MTALEISLWKINLPLPSRLFFGIPFCVFVIEVFGLDVPLLGASSQWLPSNQGSVPGFHVSLAWKCRLSMGCAKEDATGAGGALGKRFDPEKSDYCCVACERRV